MTNPLGKHIQLEFEEKSKKLGNGYDGVLLQKQAFITFE